MKKITVLPNVITLISTRSVYKTEGFISLTKKTAKIDAFISRIAEGIFADGGEFAKNCTAQTGDGKYTLYIHFSGGDAVFYKYIGTTDGVGTDRSLENYLLRDKLEIIVNETKDGVFENELNRLYLVSGSDGAVNFPYLNETQRKIVETEDANMLVQGVAGSGKTNVCVEKIVRCACKNYRGAVLYTTFSRGLLAETRGRVELFNKNLEIFLSSYAEGRVKFLDGDRKKAVENKLGVTLTADSGDEIFGELKRISEYLKKKVDYLLIEDIYARYFPPKKVAYEGTFTGEYTGGGKNYRLSGAVDKIKNIAPEIIYKEIYGMIFGKYDADNPKAMLGRGEYAAARAESFTPRECGVIYTVAEDYDAFLKKRGYTDNNLMSRELLGKITSPAYSVGVIDEVQDFTQVNLCLLKAMCRKLFCVGDALQMINPSYFNFGYLKRLMYGEITGVSELKHNYRSTGRIESIAGRLSEMNVKRFGTHSFVLKGESVPSPLPSEAVYVKGGGFVQALGDGNYGNATVIVSTRKRKEKLKKALGKIEVLTVAEAKGLERNTVVLVDVLSDNADKWRYLTQAALNRKTADENSVYRYYFNLFYVGISRARQYLFVAERESPKLFDGLFGECFNTMGTADALALLKEVARKTEIDDDELIERIEKFCILGQFENALSTADRISDATLRRNKREYIRIYENFLQYGKYREAGVEYWKAGMDAEAREMFTRSGDEQLFPLMDACAGGGGVLDVSVLKFYPLVQDNETAKSIILGTLSEECGAMRENLNRINEKLKRKKR